jgi:hypothetical protein
MVHPSNEVLKACSIAIEVSRGPTVRCTASSTLSVERHLSISSPAPLPSTNTQ